VQAAGFVCPVDPNDFDAETHGLELMQAMRATPGNDISIGGSFLQISTVNADGVAARNFRVKWKDLPNT
jgi:hypothetical protein